MKHVVVFAAGLALVTVLGWWSGAPAAALDAQRELVGVFLPVLALSAGAGASWGLAQRERVRLGLTHSSPSAAWIGKRLALAGLFVAAALVTAPLPLPHAVVWLSALGTSAGAVLYLSNLPVRL